VAAALAPIGSMLVSHILENGVLATGLLVHMQCDGVQATAASAQLTCTHHMCSCTTALRL
jgi:hypothetical protein